MASYTTDYVVCLTSYPARKNNLLTVINSLEMQTVRPNCIYLTLYDGDVEAMRDVLDTLPYSVIVCHTMEDRKVWDKFLPRITNMPADTAVLVVDDDTMPKEVVRKDEKVGAQSLEDIREMAKAKEVLSTTDAVAADMRTFLQQTFKIPCKYERRMD